METKHSTTISKTSFSPYLQSVRDKVKQNVDYHSSEKYDKNNKRPAKSVNFSGSASLSKDTAKIIQNAVNKMVKEGVREYKGIKKAPEWAYKIINSDLFARALKLVGDNEALFENIITIFLAGMLKPICVLAMPGAEEEDKQAAATKNFVAAVVGFMLSNIILTPVSNGVKKILADIPNYIENPAYRKLIDPKEFGDELVKIGKNEVMEAGKLADAYSTFYKKVADLAITPTKAKITITFMPFLLNFLFGKKKAEKAAAKKAQAEASLKHIKLNQDENELYKNFAGGLKL